MKKRRTIGKEGTITVGSGNVFADLGIPNPEQELLKTELTLQIYRIIKQRNLKQTEAGKILGISQPHVSALGGWPSLDLRIRGCPVLRFWMGGVLT